MSGGLRQFTLAVLALIALLSACAGSPVVSAQTASPGSQADPNSALLQPGDSVTFASPYMPLVIPRGAPPPPAIFGPLNVEVANDSDQPLAASYEAVTTSYGGQAAQIDLALPDGYALRAFLMRALGAPRGFTTACMPVGGQANMAACSFGLSAMPGGTDHLAVQATPAAGAQSLTLPPSTTVALIGPQPEGYGDVPALMLIGSGPPVDVQPVDVQWDGSTVELTAPQGYAISVDSIGAPPRQAASQPLDCDVPASSPNAIDCAVNAIPAVQVDFHTVLQAPGGTFAIAYSDKDGPGTMTITNVGGDVAPGGAAIDVSLVQGDSRLAGAGVMRPGYEAGGFTLAFEMVDASDDRYLFQAQVTADGGGFSGKGLWLSEADETVAGAWSAGTPPDRMAYYSAGSISVAVPGGIHGIQGAQSPPLVPLPAFMPGLPLPIFTRTSLVGGAYSMSQPGQPTSATEPPVLAHPGQALTLLAAPGPPCCGPGASETFQWSFGDGTMSEPSSQQTATHVWTAAGTYTVAAVFTDGTGVRTFGLTQIRIAP